MELSAAQHLKTVSVYFVLFGDSLEQGAQPAPADRRGKQKPTPCFGSLLPSIRGALLATPRSHPSPPPSPGPCSDAAPSVTPSLSPRRRDVPALSPPRSHGPRSWLFAHLPLDSEQLEGQGLCPVLCKTLHGVCTSWRQHTWVFELLLKQRVLFLLRCGPPAGLERTWTRTSLGTRTLDCKRTPFIFYMRKWPRELCDVVQLWHSFIHPLTKTVKCQLCEALGLERRCRVLGKL